MRKLLLFLVTFLSIASYGQDYLMTGNATYNTCSGNFYDSGGANGNYANNLVQVVTFCPDTNNSSIQVYFTMFDLGSGDFLEIYDGTTVNPATLIATYEGTDLPLTHVASGSNTSGCLTFRFVSDANVTGAGWAATIECVAPCQVIQAEILSSAPPANDNNVIKACVGQSISLIGSATYSNPSIAGTYLWDFGDGTTAEGPSTNHIYNAPGIYRLTLSVVDENNCRSTNLEQRIIQISGDPITTSTIPDLMCFDTEYTFDITAEFERYELDCTPPVTGTTFLPDGNNNKYRTSVDLFCYDDNAVITSGDQVRNVCLNMEHSFSNDLTITLIAPNGTAVRLHNRGGGGTYIGQANDDGSLAPGTGETYCWNMDAATLLINGPTIIGGSNPPSAMYVPGDYLPVDNFDAFIGSPVNGTWTIEVWDQAAVDNGYIFWWSLEMDTSLLSAQYSFQPEVTSIDWADNGMIISQDNDGKTLTVKPNAAGEVCFTATIHNDNGCTFERQFCTTVTPPMPLGTPRVVKNCADDQGVYVHDLTVVENDLSTIPHFEFEYYPTQEDAENNTNEITDPEHYTLTVEDSPKQVFVKVKDTELGCEKIVPITVITRVCALELNQLSDLSVCGEANNQFNLTVQTPLVYNNNTGYAVTYHNTEAAAEANTGAITEPLLSNYTATSGETIWVRVTSINSPQVYAVTSFRLWVNALPSVNPDAGPMYGCEIPGTGTGDFTLSLNDGNLTLNQPGLTVTYYQTQQQAEVGDATVALPNNYQGPQGTIYARVTNNNTGCYIVVAQELVVRSTPVANNHAPLIFCDADNDGFGIFNLEAISHEIAGNPIPAGIEVSYHESLSDAQNNVEAISTPSAFVNTQANGQTLYVRVGYEHSSCASIVPLELIVSKTPAIKRPTPLMVCDADNNGIAIFDLTVKNTEILNGLPAADYTFTYHTTAANAQQGTNAIANPTSYSNQTTGTVYVRVTNTATGCFSVVPLSLVAGATPVVAHPIAEYAQCDDNQDGFATFNLNSRIPSILNGQTGMAVTFHYTAADAQSGAAALPLSYQNVVANIQTLHVRVTNQATGCYTVSTMNLRVIAGPVITVPDTPYAVCSSGQSGFGTVDLTYYGNQLVLGTGYQISYFETETNAIANTSPIGLPTAYNNLVGSNPVIWLRITNPVTGCFSVYSISFVLEIAPLMPDTLPDLTECDVLDDLYDGLTTFDLTEQDAAILAAQTGTGPYVIRYYTSEAAAVAGQPWIADPVNFVNTQANQTIWVRIENSSNQNKCNAIGSFKLKVNTPLQLGAAPDLVQCNESLPNDESTVFDLTVNESLITQGQVFGATVTYHTSLVNAEAGLNDIPDPTAFTNTSNPQVIWVAVTNEFGCKAYKTFNVRVLPLPEPNLTPSPLQVCEEAPGSGEGFFVLTDAIPDISNGDPTLTYEFYTTEEDALTGLSDLALDSTVPHLSVTSVIYVRVMNQFAAENMSCAVIVPLELIVNPTPLAGPMTPLLHCEQGSDGIHKFNLHDKDAEALAGQPSGDYTVRYFLTEEDAQNNTNPIPYTYTNNGSPFDQEIWVRVENTDSGCFAITTFHLKVEEQVFAFPATDNLSFCDIDGVNDGLTVVDLTLLNAQIIGIQDAGPLDVRYYASAANYSLGIVIGDPTQYQTESNPQTLIAEVYNTGEGMLCKATIEVTINVIDAPEMNDIKDGYICEDYRTGERQGYPMDTGLPAEGHTFSWTRNGDDIGVSTPSYTATEPGTYVVTVTNTATGCSASQTIVLTLAPALSIDVVYTTDGFSDTNAIEVVVSPAGDYEYALDEGPYQQSNIFMNVSPGDHTVWVRVRNSAGSVACPASKVITVLNYPKYFTPNGDGYNDTWNIWALKSQPASKIYIFDRHGKLLKQISPAGSGWDGTLNGNPLPSTDYWFRVEYVEPNTGLQKEARGHFSLKR